MTNFSVFNDGRPNKPPPPKPVGQNIAHVQAQVDDVRNVARQNIDRVLKREDKLNDLADRSHNLEEGAKIFNSAAGKLKRKVTFKIFSKILKKYSRYGGAISKCGWLLELP